MSTPLSLDIHTLIPGGANFLPPMDVLDPNYPEFSCSVENAGLLKLLSENGELLAVGHERAFLSAVIGKYRLTEYGACLAIVPDQASLNRVRSSLDSMGVDSLWFEPSNDKPHKRNTWLSMEANQANVVLVVAEMLRSKKFSARLISKNISHIALLQGERLSPWHSRFSPSFRSIAKTILNDFDRPTAIHAWSGSQKVISELKRSFLIHSEVNLTSPITKAPQLYSHRVQSEAQKKEAFQDFVMNQDRQGVVFVSSIRNLHLAQTWLEELGEQSSILRAQMSSFERRRVIQEFEKGSSRLVISDGSFLSLTEHASGLDFAVFLGMPNNLEFLSREVFSHVNPLPISIKCIHEEGDFYQYRFLIDRMFPDVLHLRRCFGHLLDIFRSNSFLPLQAVLSNLEIVTDLGLQEIKDCLDVFLREGVVEEIFEEESDTRRVALVDRGEGIQTLWGEYTQRKSDMVKKLNDTKKLLAKAGDLGNELATQSGLMF
jgi:hypothetical protein